MSNIKSIDPFELANNPEWPEMRKSSNRQPRLPKDDVRISFLTMKNGRKFMPVTFPFHPGFNPLGMGSRFDAENGRDYGPNFNIVTKYDIVQEHLVFKPTPEPIEGMLNSSCLRRQNGHGYFLTHVPVSDDQPWQFYCSAGVGSIPHSYKLYESYGCFVVPLKRIIKVAGYDHQPEKNGRNNTGTDWS